MRKLVFVGLLFAGTALASVGTSDPASASWCYRGYGYGYGYAPAGYGYSPRFYRSYYRPRFYGAAFYRPRVYGWGGWGRRGWGWGRRRWGWRHGRLGPA
jgi:hypothetical protein